MQRQPRLLSCLLLLAAAPGCAVLGPYSPTAKLESRGIFQPSKYPKGEWAQTDVLVQDAHFAAADGTKLHGWYVPHDQPKGHALLLHGNSGNVTLLSQTLRTLNRRHNLAVLALDYRGFGKSEGAPTEAGLYQDARAARAWFAETAHIAETDVILMGVSVGGAVAVNLAASDGARGLVLASTFTSLPAAAQHHQPWLPMNLLLSTRMDSLSKIPDYHGPVLIVHGDADEVVPYAQGKTLFEAANEPKKLITAKGTKHNDPLPEDYRVALDEFVAHLPPLGSSKPKLASIHIE
ncbi:MAG TPA: alpha/beta hydrolase [Pirellulaceae bacterium]